MSFLSLDLRTHIGHLILAATMIVFVWLLQTDLLSRFSVAGLVSNLPMTFTIVWAAVFGSRLKRLALEDYRSLSLGEIVFYQALCGSVSACLVGALFAALYASVLPIYLFSYPVIGWIAGYFSLKNANQGMLLAIPLVLFASILGEAINASQLMILGRPEVIARFVAVALPASILNALIAPIIYLPMRTWYEFWTNRQVTVIE